jgi:hypothetical protein
MKKSTNPVVAGLPPFYACHPWLINGAAGRGLAAVSPPQMIRG